ncbi:hypothetical protein B0G57_104290 [Trinickia symbiotica]|uniref:Uncharacterized protein n=1 Tax=Trinickia symbiotica TaxID=863227 RepID=A0A2N7X3H3_9BURK|nr:hypothetical protein C0Z20_15240 [Trinickia symbiotica]PPK45885.1 hypothetical protein B0G57_104290 [Trinickia symbiotica]
MHVQFAHAALCKANGGEASTGKAARTVSPADEETRTLPGFGLPLRVTSRSAAAVAEFSGETFARTGIVFCDGTSWETRRHRIPDGAVFASALSDRPPDHGISGA